MSKITSAFALHRHRAAGLRASAPFVSPSLFRERLHGHAVVEKIQAAGQPRLQRHCLHLFAILGLIFVTSIGVVLGVGNGSFSAISDTTRGATISGGNTALPPAFNQAWTMPIKLRHVATQPMSVRAELFNALGVNCLSQGDTAGAIDCFHRALAVNPLLVAARNNLAAAMLQAGDAKGARAAFQATLELQPNNSYALMRLKKLSK